MMTDRKDPPRFDEEGPEALRALMHVVRDRGPSDAAAERISKRLAMAGVPMAPAKGTLAGRRLAYPTLALVVALGVSAAIAIGWRATRAPTSANTPSPSATFEEAPRALGPTTPAVSEPTGVDRVTAVETGVVSIADLPSAAPPPPPSGAGGVKRKTSIASVGGEQASTELEIMQRAEAALASDPDSALAITKEHARAYPSGELVQERELIAVEALSRIGRKEEALERAQALVRRFPRTPYAARLELAIGKPLASLGTPRNQ